MSIGPGTTTRAPSRPTGETATAERCCGCARSATGCPVPHDSGGAARCPPCSSRWASWPRWASGSACSSTGAPAPATLDGVNYLDFVAPGLIAATAMQTAAFESTFPVMGAIKWHRQYHAMLATPLRVGRRARRPPAVRGAPAGDHASPSFARDRGAVRGHRVAVGGAHACRSAVLTGLAYATPVFAFSADPGERQRRSRCCSGSASCRCSCSPARSSRSPSCPTGCEPVACVVPLWHGVDLCRALVAGHADLRPGGWARGLPAACGSWSGSSSPGGRSRAPAGSPIERADAARGGSPRPAS